jgi:hypothetical protein
VAHQLATPNSRRSAVRSHPLKVLRDALADSKGTAGELLILDLCNNLEGFNQFFAGKQVHDGGDMIFASVESRDLWVSALRTESVTYVFGIKRNPCGRNGPKRDLLIKK